MWKITSLGESCKMYQSSRRERRGRGRGSPIWRLGVACRGADARAPRLPLQPSAVPGAPLLPPATAGRLPSRAAARRASSPPP